MGRMSVQAPRGATTLLSEAMDPNLLYEIRTSLEVFPVYAPAERQELPLELRLA